MRAILRLELDSNSDYVDIAIADAIAHVRDKQFWFNGARHTFTTVDGQYRYKLPSDFISLRGKPRVTPANSTASGRYPLLPATADEVEDLLYTGVDFGSYQERGYAKRHAIDLIDDYFLIAPMPSTAGDVIEFKYTKDLGTPTYTVAATSSSAPAVSPTVTLKGPNGETLESSFTSAWFINGKGFKLVKERALFELFSRWHGGTEEAVVQAQLANARYEQELNRLKAESADKQSIVKIRGHL